VFLGAAIWRLHGFGTAAPAIDQCWRPLTLTTPAAANQQPAASSPTLAALRGRGERQSALRCLTTRTASRAARPLSALVSARVNRPANPKRLMGEHPTCTPHAGRTLRSRLSDVARDVRSRVCSCFVYPRWSTVVLRRKIAALPPSCLFVLMPVAEAPEGTMSSFPTRAACSQLVPPEL
jgi:hypothetical protein